LVPKPDLPPAWPRGLKASQSVKAVHSESTAKTLSASGFRFGLPDLNDGKPWSEMDERDLKAELEHGSSIEEEAGHLCRSGTVDEVKKKAEEMG
jgi:hypothetical protein